MIESKHVAHVSIVVDIPINCCVRLLHLVPILMKSCLLTVPHIPFAGWSDVSLTMCGISGALNLMSCL